MTALLVLILLNCLILWSQSRLIQAYQKQTSGNHGAGIYWLVRHCATLKVTSIWEIVIQYHPMSTILIDFQLEHADGCFYHLHQLLLLPLQPPRCDVLATQPTMPK